MDTNAILDIAIGLVLMYLVLSLVCTSLNEWISTIFKLRADTLRTSLVSIIDDPKVRTVFYGHGLIQGSFAPSTKTLKAGSTPATAAAAPVMGSPAQATVAAPAPAQAKVADPAPAQTTVAAPAPAPLDPAVSGATTAIPAGKGHPAYLSGSTFALALLDSLNKDPKVSALSFDDIKAAAAVLPESNVRDMLLSNIALAEGKVDALRTHLAMSFDHMMDRASGEYKKLIKLISILVGFLLALLINADSIKVGKALWSDAALRTQMAQSARQIVDNKGCSTAPSTPTSTSTRLSGD